MFTSVLTLSQPAVDSLELSESLLQRLLLWFRWTRCCDDVIVVMTERLKYQRPVQSSIGTDPDGIIKGI